LKLTVNFSALDARYISYPNASVPQGVVGLVPGETCTPSPTGGPPSCAANASGHYLTNAPATSAFGAVDYTHDLIAGFRVTAHLDYNWHSRAYFDPSNIMILSQGKYGLLNGQLLVALPNNAWRVGLFGRNLTNKVYAVQQTAPGLWPQALPGDPRTYGAQLSYNW
jgi:iron complex outermembrane receptor protein